VLNVANPLLHGTPGGWGNTYNAIDGRDEMTNVHENVPYGLAGGLLFAGGVLILLKRAGFVDIGVKASAGGR
jgi:hypothetical protein